MNVEGDISCFMFIKLYLKFFFQHRCYAAGHFVFFIKQDTDVLRQWIADLLSPLKTADSKIKMIRYWKKDRTIDIAKFCLSLPEDFIGKFQTYR